MRDAACVPTERMDFPASEERDGPVAGAIADRELEGANDAPRFPLPGAKGASGFPPDFDPGGGGGGGLDGGADFARARFGGVGIGIAFGIGFSPPPPPPPPPAAAAIALASSFVASGALCLFPRSNECSSRLAVGGGGPAARPRAVAEIALRLRWDAAVEVAVLGTCGKRSEFLAGGGALRDGGRLLRALALAAPVEATLAVGADAADDADVSPCNRRSSARRRAMLSSVELSKLVARDMVPMPALAAAWAVEADPALRLIDRCCGVPPLRCFFNGGAIGLVGETGAGAGGATEVSAPIRPDCLRGAGACWLCAANDCPVRGGGLLLR
mmetsp:Transcript_20285/g.57593  ORF Transcript_20285/g.57593 Transcript_20285/m.57593 type:complete len:328 (+) Transcript_20285:336-1319(+)